MRKIRIILFLFLTALLFSCSGKYTPKPRGYFRISFPEKTYTPLDSAGLPYSFDIPTYAKVCPDADKTAEPFWINISVPANNAEIHISYKKVANNLKQLTEDSHTLAYKHTVKASAIDEQLFVNPQNKVFGTIYFIDGNAASPIQFFLTDSTRHFLRGALYIREVPNIDSVRPVIDFLKPDIIRLIESTQWK